MTPDQITDTAVLLFGIQRADLFGRSRVARLDYARHAVAWALRQSNWSLESIGSYLRRDHTTIIYGLKAIERHAAHNRFLKERLDALHQPIAAPKDWRDRITALEAQVAELTRQLAEMRGQP